MLQPGVILSGRYEIIEKVGSGGMSIVYKAKCNKLERFVAIKVLRDEFCLDEEFVRRFKVEAQSAASLSHNNIVNIYDVGNDKNIYYIVMELLEGITLKEYIKNNAPLTDAETIKIAASIASALEHAHENHIIHRDIKPQNIIITKDGIAKVADFGIARVATDKTIVAPTNASGSVHYISPEQARGGFCDEKSDLYSLGITMYEMATGTLPYQAESPVSVALLHINEDLPSPREKNPNITKCLESIIIKSTLKKTEFRYSSADELMEDLKKANISPKEDFVDIKIVDDSPTLFMSDNDMKKIWKEKDNNTVTEKKSKLEKVVVFLGVVSAIVLVSIVSYFVFNSIKAKLQPVEVLIPDVQGMLLSDAKKLLEEKHLTIDVTERIYDDTYDMDKIISQIPEENTVAEKNQIVKLTVSKGIQTFEVPDVRSVKFTTAQSIIQGRHLTYKIEREYHDSIPLGIVIRQYPDTGTKLKKGEVVTIFVSKGKEEKTVIVPNLKELTEQQAVNKLNKTNLELGNVTRINHDTVAKGKIINQTVDPGEEVKENYVIDIAISLGRKISIIHTETINNIFDPNQTEGQLKAVLVNKGKESVVFNKLVKSEDFPLPIIVSGEGDAIIKIYLNDVYQYENPFVFTKEEAN
ncbi:Stk1 family PASTA domain-containing Ser/Thr kinase [Vallitalea sp.]|jgi:serine/threonine-protein kinase|uniref:Stk1 family PASTA domain-containing Ser/Thr kinase n=1 Tax=Vallitalea sp. TaxID=1882829 RepID=UPI0025CDEC6C|nr:Stk1 family PASTA domain-containing Ser/Thr kinase [Vallitalea sp.]MCT4687371.1 Stk1 family PASTA domain-containing Ser/Thr kinase [Vallitalea sp.]